MSDAANASSSPTAANERSSKRGAVARDRAARRASPWLSSHQERPAFAARPVTDDEPGRRQESAERRFLSLQRLRIILQRDLSWLLNTCSLAATEDLSEYPEVATSVLNYGIPDLAGQSLSGVDVDSLERLVKQAVVAYEPRILRSSVRVDAIVDSAHMSHNALTLQIAGDLWAQPVPVDVVLRTEFDLESGLVSVRE
jgi:type VI secretion system protein ImpF